MTATDDLLRRLAGPHPPPRRAPRRSSCTRCDDHGLIQLDGRVPDAAAPDGYRPVTFAYRCTCAAGARFAAFALAPPPD